MEADLRPAQALGCGKLVKDRTIWAMVDRRARLVAPDRDIDIGQTDEGAEVTYEQAFDGTITVTVAPPFAGGQVQRFVSRAPS